VAATNRHDLAPTASFLCPTPSTCYGGPLQGLVSSLYNTQCFSHMSTFRLGQSTLSSFLSRFSCPRCTYTCRFLNRLDNGILALVYQRLPFLRLHFAAAISLLMSLETTNSYARTARNSPDTMSTSLSLHFAPTWHLWRACCIQHAVVE
jgi:hypothetical protein